MPRGGAKLMKMPTRDCKGAVAESPFPPNSRGAGAVDFRRGRTNVRPSYSGTY
jgi:hypothetical protein